MTRKKMTNAILDANGGLDSVRALSTAHNILLNHDLQRPILYHVVITGGDIETYQAVIKKLIRRIRTKCRAEYFGAYEVAENRGGAHAHVFILIETRHNQPFKFMDIREGGYLLKLAKAHKLQKPDGTISPIHISKPKNRMHGGQMFAVPVGDELLADCLKWATYEYKSRSKEGVKRREVYFNSEFASNVAKRAVAKAQRTSRKAKPAPIPAVVTVPVALPAPLPLVDSGKVAVPHPDGVVTMSSVEIVEAINAMRSPRMGKLDHDSFMPKVKEVLGFASTAFLGFCQDSNGSTVKCYHLPKRESTLMMMADSLEVQTQVYDRLAALEEQAAAARHPQTYGEALLALAEKVQKEEASQLEHRQHDHWRSLTGSSDIKTLYRDQCPALEAVASPRL